jgi:hypothetical protein
MTTSSNENDELKSKLDHVIQKSKAQKKILKKILNELNKQGEDAEHSATKDTTK